MKTGTLNRQELVSVINTTTTTLGEIMAHEAETRKSIQTKVNQWLNNNPAEMQLLQWDFQDELEENLNFNYKRSQFRCWVWDTVVKRLEK